MLNNSSKLDHGFSLIELLVAVAILSLVAFTLLQSQAGALRSTGVLQEHALADIVAKNQLARSMDGFVPPIVGSQTGEEQQLGMVFLWRENVKLAPGGDLLSIEVSVRRLNSDAEIVRLVGFRRAKL